MPSDIHFAGDNKPLRVNEEPSEVFDAWNAAHGLPFRLTPGEGRAEVYVNPATVTFWIGIERPEFPVPPPHPPVGLSLSAAARSQHERGEDEIACG